MGKHILGWLIATLLMIFVLPAIISPSVYVAQVKKEQAALVNDFGSESAEKIIKTADNTYSEIFEESGIHSSFISHFAIPEKDILNNKPIQNDPLNPNGVAKYERIMQAYFVGLFISFYEWIFRATQIFMWFALAFPFVIAAAWDGLMHRKIRSSTFDHSSPAIYNGLWHGIIAFVFATNLIFNMPFTVKPLIYPIMIVIIALFIRSLLSNLQRSA